jgi:murein L,D-transpeptidase YafK
MHGTAAKAALPSLVNRELGLLCDAANRKSESRTPAGSLRYTNGVRICAEDDSLSKIARRLALKITCVAAMCLATSIGIRPQASKSVDRIVILKSARTMTLMSHGEVLKTYKVALGTEPVGAKQRTGDHKTPEGLYKVDWKNAQSKFHKALHVSYPNAEDRARAKKMGVEPGGEIEIHGLGSKFGWVGALHRKRDWTDGCIAVTNEEIDEIWALVPVGTVIEIKP